MISSCYDGFVLPSLMMANALSGFLWIFWGGLTLLFLMKLKPKNSSPVIFQADVRFRLMKDGRGGYGGSKIPHVND